MENSYGGNIRLKIFGGSHDECIGMRLWGIPKGHAIDLDELCAFMARRAPGGDSFSTQRREKDTPVFLSGVEDGVTTGDVIEAVIYNQNQHSGDYASLSDTPRPSHADLAARLKYGDDVDLRGGGHFSGRLTAPLCIAGGICLQILKKQGVTVGAHVYSVGEVSDTPFDMANIDRDTLEKLSGERFAVISDKAKELMISEIEQARLDGDSVGGVIECAATGLPQGLGEHMFCSVEGRISSIMFAIPAVKGVEFGLGFGSAKIRGSQNNDAIYTDGVSIKTRTNNAGGILGGMTNGMPVVFRVAVKPTPSIALSQDTVSLSRMENVKITVGGRHDPCIVPRAVPAVEAACAIAIFDMLCDK